MKHTLLRNLRNLVTNSAYTLLLVVLLFPAGVRAEGTKQVRPDSTISAAALMVDWIDPLFTRFCMPDANGGGPNYRLYIHIENVGEKILFGLKAPYGSIGWNLKRPDGTIPAGMSGNSYPQAGTGYITYYSQAIKGPFPAIGGYTPLQYTADVTGDWYFEITDVHDGIFTDCATFDLWDFQVVTGANTPALPGDTINGRVWSQSWQMYARLETPNYFNGSLYVYTDDGIVTKLVCNGMGMGEGTFFCNEVGCLSTGNFPIDRQSKNSNTYTVFPGIAQYKVFLNNPDITVYPNGSFGVLNSVTYHNDSISPCSWDKYFTINVSKKGQIVLKIDVPYGDPTYDVFIVTNVVAGNNTIPWDGKDGHGGMVPNGTTLTIVVDFLNGLTNLPLWDFEGNPNGFKVYPVRPIGPGLLDPMFYWDDSQLTPTGGTTGCTNPPTTVNLTGCVPASSTCHDWPTMCHNKMLNTWWYSGSTSSVQVVMFSSQPQPTVAGPAPVCVGTTGSVYTTEPGMFNYTWAVSAGGTITGGGTPTSNTITIDWNVLGAQWVSVTYTGLNGCPSVVTTFPVEVGSQFVPSVSIVADANPVCSGTLVNYTATPVNGGTSPSYQWMVNGVNQGTNSPTFSWTPANGNTIRCRMTSSLTCASPATALSNTITMSVSNPLPASVNIVASANPICAGDPVTFTALPINGGTTPSYQWRVNGANAGTNSSTFTYYPSNGDMVLCRMTSSLWCAAPKPANSNTINMTVRSRPVPTITGTTPVCVGSSYTYTTQPGFSNYTWTVSAGGTITAGQGTYQVTINWNTAGSQLVTVNYRNTNCYGIAPGTFPVTVNPRPVPTITGPASACVGSIGNVYTTEPGMVGYTWTISAGGNITAGAGTNSITVTWNTAGSRWVRVTYTSPFGCTPVTYTQFDVNVQNALPVSVSIAASVNPVCAGTAVTFTATPVNGGSAPSYQWQVNGANQGANSATYIYTPNNGDVIRCILTSNLACALGNPATSNSITVVVNPLLPVSVSITAFPYPMCPGTPATFTATAVNGGSAPFYQWKVNGVNQGTNNPVYTYTPISGQTVTCVLTSNALCATVNPATSNPIHIVMDNTPPVISPLPGDTTIECPAVPVFVTPTATDTTDPNPVLTYIDSITPGSCPQEYSIMRIWTATDDCGNTSTASQTVSIIDTTPPQITTPPPPLRYFCVINIITADFYPDTMDITPVRPDYYILTPADKSSFDLDPGTFWDNCSLTPDLVLHWRIDFSGGVPPPLTGTGQISAYAGQILFPGAPIIDVTHTVSYWLEDECHNLSSEVMVTVIIKPRPHVIKLTN